MTKRKVYQLDDVLRDLEGQIKEAGSARQWAFENDFSAAFVSYVTTGRREPSARMLEYLGYERATEFFYKKGE